MQTTISECIWTYPIEPSDADVDVISQELVDLLLDYNDKYEKHCEEDD